MHLTLEKKIIAVIIVLAGIILLIVAAVVIPTLNQIKKLDQETYDLRVYLEKKYEHSVSARAALKQIDAIKIETDKVPGYLFHAGDALRLITELESIAAKNTIGQRVTRSNLDSMADDHMLVSLAITGSYQGVLNYLADLENVSYFITVKHLSLAPANTKNAATATTPVTMNLDISLYVSPQ